MRERVCVPGISQSTSLEGEAAASVAAAVAQEELGEEEAPPPYKHISCRVYGVATVLPLLLHDLSCKQQSRRESVEPVSDIDSPKVSRIEHALLIPTPTAHQDERLGLRTWEKMVRRTAATHWQNRREGLKTFETWVRRGA